MAKPNCTTYAAPSNLEELAEKKGLVVVYPKMDELFLDIDSSEAFGRFEEHLYILDREMPGFLLEVRSEPSASGGEHRHITLTLNRYVAAEERILLQAILGSDPKRELLSYIFFSRGREKPTCFFEKP